MTKTVILLFLLSGGFFISCSNSEGNQNYKNLHEVQVGMKIGQVHRIMKNPPLKSGIPYFNIDTLFIETYESTVGEGDDFMIIYSKKDSTVTEIFWGD